MDPNPILAFFHLVLTLILIHHIHNYVCADDYHYANCSHTFDCSGHVNLTYPFWGSNRPSYCGHPEFELNCTKNIPLITIESVDFRVLELNQKNNTLVVARDDYWELSTCPKEFRNTTLGSSVFNFSSDSQSLTVYYHCPQPKMATNVYYRTDTVNGTVTSSVLDTVLVNGTATPTTTPTVVVANGTATPTATPTVVVANGTATPTATPTVVANGTANASVEQNNLFKCYKNGEEWSNYFFTEATKGNLTGGINAQTCDETMILRISNSVDGGITRNISTSLVSALRTGFGLNWKLNVSSSCDECKASGGYCGSDQNEGQFVCYCVNGPEPFKCRHGLHVDLNLLIGLSVGSFIIISIVIIYIIWRKKKETGTSDVEKLVKNFGSFAPKRYSYFNVKKITNSFTERIGKGGFGTVYKGKLPDGRLVAVKLLSCSKHNGQDFINEVASISRCSHVNIVNFLGFCCEGNKRALIYEYMSNGSLDNFIFGDKGCLITNRHLQWTTLYEITIGIARGIQYLHRGCNTGILHFDIKPENILLDETLCPKISDFGLAKLWPRKESIVSMIETRGTIGYIAPEVYNRNFGAVSHKSDVYSYGMVVLEIVGGRKNVDVGVSHVSQIYYPYWIYEDIELGNDLRIEGIISEEDKEIAKKMILVSFWCIQTRPSDRPSMSKVVDMLEGSLESLMIPPKPVLCSPERPNQEPTSLALK